MGKQAPKTRCRGISLPGPSKERTAARRGWERAGAGGRRMRQEPPGDAGTEPEPARSEAGVEKRGGGGRGAWGTGSRRAVGSRADVGKWWERGSGGVRARRPYLVREQLLLGGAGAGDRGHIHVPAARRGSAPRPPPLTLHALRPPLAARRCRRRGRVRCAPLGSRTCCSRGSCASLRVPAPRPVTALGARARPALALRAYQAGCRPSRHRPAPPAAPRPKFGEGPAAACQRARAGDPPGSRSCWLPGTPAPPGPPLESRRLSWRQASPGGRPSGKMGQLEVQENYIPFPVHPKCLQLPVAPPAAPLMLGD